MPDYIARKELCWCPITLYSAKYRDHMKFDRCCCLRLRCACVLRRILKALTARTCLWSSAYERLFGTPAPSDWSSPTVKRLCRRSELRASRYGAVGRIFIGILV
jgi:hypothetical protein